MQVQPILRLLFKIVMLSHHENIFHSFKFFDHDGACTSRLSTLVDFLSPRVPSWQLSYDCRHISTSTIDLQIHVAEMYRS
jgi:hypothetical protein